MEVDITVDNVCQFIIDHGGKVKNTILVSNFKKLLNDPATKDVARQKFKECVNTVAVVKTENGEKFVQLKKKYRGSSSDLHDVSPEQSPSKSKDPIKSPNTSLNKEAVSVESPKNRTSEPSDHPPVEAKSPSVKQERKSSKKSPVHASSPTKAAAPSGKGDASSSTKQQEQPKKEQLKKLSVPSVVLPSDDPRTEDAVSSDSRNARSKPVHVKTSSNPSILQMATEREVEKADAPPTKNDLPTKIDPPTFVIPAAVPLRRQKKENVPPSPTAEPRFASVDRAKSNLLNNISADNRLSRHRPVSFVPGSYAGSVERARQNFQNKQKLNDDAASIAPSEKSLDSKGEEIDDDYDRNIPSVALDMNEKSWIIRSAQGNLVEMRVLLDIDIALAEKKDFVMTALHWAAKKGHEEMVNMLLELKVDVNGRSGYTPLHLATIHGHENVICLLLDNGADPNLRDYSGHKPIHYVKQMSLPLQRILFGNESSHGSTTKDFAAGLRSRNPTVRKSQYRLSSAISGGLSSVGILVSKSFEDGGRHPEYESDPTKSGSGKPSKLGKMKKSKKMKEERPRISVVSIDDSDSGFVNLSNSSMSGITMTSSGPTNPRLSAPSSPTSRRRSGTRGSLDETY